MRRSIGTYATKRDAERAEREALSARDRGIELSPRTVTLREQRRRYLDDCNQRCARTTIARYRSLDEHYIAPRLGNMLLAKVRRAHLAEWISALRSGGGYRGRALSPKTVRHAVVLLNTARKSAVRMQLASTNPLEAVGVPAVPPSSAKALSVDEVSALLDAAPTTR